MKTTTFPSPINIRVTYPEKNIWTEDRNVFIFEDLDSGTASGFTIQITYNGAIRCSTQGKYLLVDVSDHVKTIGAGARVLDVYVLKNGNSRNITLYDNDNRLTTLNGKSIQGRSHGATRFIECEDNGSINTELFLPKATALFLSLIHI